MTPRPAPSAAAGAWKQDGRLVLDEHGDAIAMVNIARHVNVAHEHARLIAAAPDLLDALRAIIAACDITPATVVEMCDADNEAAFERAFAAIAKATGAAP